jgi:hypothetical protein
MIEWLKKDRERPIIVSHAPMNERELAAAFRVPDVNPLWRGIQQIIEEELREVRAVATQSVKDHGILASWVGGAEALERLRARLMEQRERAMGKEAN